MTIDRLRMPRTIIDGPRAKDFEKYGVKPFNKTIVVKELGELMRKGTFLVWLDTIVPMYNKKTWNLLGHVGMVISTNTRARMLTMLEHV